jgi:hypothetical protein
LRFELTGRDDRSEFWVFDVDPALEAALRDLWWRQSGSGWRRSFACPPARAAAAFANLRRLLEPSLRQAAGLEAVPWQDALAEVCGRFEPAGMDWWLAGSAALAVRGAPITPRDLDLIVTSADSVRAGEVLADGLIEPVVRGEWELSDWWGRAFVHARVEWVGGVTAAADQPEITDFGPAAAAALQTVRWRDWHIRVPPLGLQRAVSARRGLSARAAVIDGLGGCRGVTGKSGQRGPRTGGSHGRANRHR